MSSSPVSRSLQGRRAAAKRHGHSTAELDRDYAAARIADYIRLTVDAAPPLTPEQRDRLAALLRPTAVSGGAA